LSKFNFFSLLSLSILSTSGSHLSRALARKFFAEEEKSVSAASFRLAGGGATWRPWGIVA